MSAKASPVYILTLVLTILAWFTGVAIAGEKMWFQADRTGAQYVSLQLGTPYPEPNSMKVVNSAGTAFTGTEELEPGMGFLVDFLYGKYITDRLHAEFKLSFGYGSNLRTTLAKGFTGNAMAGMKVPAQGIVRSFGAMANARYDFFKFDNGVRVFAGAGAGILYLDMDNIGPVASPFRLNDSDTIGILCLLTGLNVPVAKNIELTAQYTAVYMAATSFASTTSGSRLNVGTGAGFRHIGTVGLRYFLN